MRRKEEKRKWLGNKLKQWLEAEPKPKAKQKQNKPRLKQQLRL